MALVGPSTTTSLNAPHDIRIAIVVVAVGGFIKLFADVARRPSTHHGGFARWREPGVLRPSYLAIAVVIVGLVVLLHHDNSLCASHPGFQAVNDDQWNLGTVKCF
jgi:hypothetical protein